MRQRTSIVLTSILKPVDDTRMFEKFGLSLGQTNKYDVNIIGFAAKNLKKIDNIHFYPLFDFGRISFSRLFAPFRLLLLLFKVKPSIVIFNTPEILYIIILYKLISGCRIIYDIQENYFRNVYYNKNYILPIRFLLSCAIRFKEWSGRWLIDGIIFAEEGYKVEMPRSAGRAVVIRNTYKDLDVKGLGHTNIADDKDLKGIKTIDLNTSKLGRSGNTDGITSDAGSLTFLFSGTISDSYGIFTAIDFIDGMHAQYPLSNLLIAGYCANERIFRKLMARIENRPYIKLIGGDHLVPHAEIIHHIKEADYGLICYEINPSLENCFPTKIFEYMANQLPIIIQDYKPWSSYCLKHKAGIEINYEKLNPELLLNSFKNGNFYSRGIPDEVFWNKDEEKLLKLVEDIQA
jgi:hypothetical protein